MPHISIPTGLASHPAIWQLAKDSGTSRFETVGLLYSLWDYAAQYAKGATIERLDPDKLASFIGGTRQFWELAAKTEWVSYSEFGVHVKGSPTKSHKRQHGTVYFLAASEAVKIGFTAQETSQRLAVIQIGSSERLRIVLEIPGSKPLEKRLHRQFEHLRLSGEWFRLAPPLTDFITSNGGSL